MFYYEVLPASGHYRSNTPLTYSSDVKLPTLCVVTVPLQHRTVTGFVTRQTNRPSFAVKPIKAVMSPTPLPAHCLQLAKWIQHYYHCSLAEALRQFAPTKPSLKRHKGSALPEVELQLEWRAPLTAEQRDALQAIRRYGGTTIMLHGETGTGKTRVYLELAKDCLAAGRSVILLTPEISLISQLAQAADKYLGQQIFVLHSQLTDAQRKKIWFEILEAQRPVVVVGPRSALFSPVTNVGLIVLDESHEPAYKQDQSPRYHATRVASQLGIYTDAKVVFGSATPSVSDYYLADRKGAVVRMIKPASGGSANAEAVVVDLKNRADFSRSSHLSKKMIDVINSTLSAKKQIMIYLNRRGSARLILCKACGWQFLCPNCDIPLVYHGDEHLVRCHTCGFDQGPPVNCPQCSNPDIIYRSIGSKALAQEITRLFPNARVQRFDSDNEQGQRLNELYAQVASRKIDILVGTQLLAKGLDLPHLGMVGIVSAETSLSLPDYSSEERSFQLLYQVIGRIGRGHGQSTAVVQSYDPNNIVVRSALKRDWGTFYTHMLKERKQFQFPPFIYLAQLVCRRASLTSAEAAANKLKARLETAKLPVEIIGPSPSFYARRGEYYYFQLVIKARQRKHLVEIANLVPADWQINLDPADLL